MKLTPASLTRRKRAKRIQQMYMQRQADNASDDGSWVDEPEEGDGDGVGEETGGPSGSGSGSGSGGGGGGESSLDDNGSGSGSGIGIGSAAEAFQMARQAGRVHDPFEKLPNEILQPIFMMSQNMNFPRSSHTIGIRLSSSDLLKKLVWDACEPTWFCFHPAIYAYCDPRIPAVLFADCPGDPVFQSDVFAAPWFKVELVLDAQDRFMKKYPRSSRPVFIPTMGVDTIYPAERASQRFEMDYKELMTIPTSKTTAIMERFMRMRTRCRRPYMSMHPSFHIPDAWLRGPLTRDGIRRLFWVVITGNHLDDGHTWEMLEESFLAIMEPVSAKPDHKEVVLMLLLYTLLGVFHERWPPHVLERNRLKTEDMSRKFEKKYGWSAWTVACRLVCGTMGFGNAWTDSEEPWSSRFIIKRIPF